MRALLGEDLGLPQLQRGAEIDKEMGKEADELWRLVNRKGGQVPPDIADVLAIQRLRNMIAADAAGLSGHKAAAADARWRRPSPSVNWPATWKGNGLVAAPIQSLNKAHPISP